MRETPASLLTRGRQQALTAALLIGEQSAPQLKARPSPHPNRLNLPLYQRPPEWQILEKTPSGLKNHLVQPPSSTQISMTSPANDLPAFACRRPMRRLFRQPIVFLQKSFLFPRSVTQNLPPIQTFLWDYSEEGKFLFSIKVIPSSCLLFYRPCP